MQSGKTQIKPNHKAVRVVSNAIPLVALIALQHYLFTLVVLRHKDYGIGKLILINIGLNLAAVIAVSFVERALSVILKLAVSSPKLIKGPNKEETYNELLKTARGPIDTIGITTAALLIFNLSSCVTLEILGQRNILDPSASKKAAIFIGVLTLLAAPLLIGVIILDLVGRFEGLKKIEDASLINTLVAQVRVNNYCKELAKGP